MEIDDSVLPTDDSGDNVSGTKTNRSFFATFKAAINAIIHSTTNPTVYVKNIIDEVVAARDGYATLLAKLNAIAQAKIYSDYIEKQNTGTGVDTLCSVTLTGVTLNVGDNLHIRGWGKCAANANIKQIQLIIDGVTLFSVPNGGSLNDAYWSVDATVQKKSSLGWTGRGTLLYNVLNTAGGVLGLGTNSGTTALSGLTVYFTGEGVATADIVQYGMVVKVERAQ